MPHPPPEFHKRSAGQNVIETVEGTVASSGTDGDLTKRSSDSLAMFSLRQEQLKVCVEKGVANILDQQQTMSQILSTRIDALSEGLHNLNSEMHQVKSSCQKSQTRGLTTAMSRTCTRMSTRSHTRVSRPPTPSSGRVSRVSVPEDGEFRIKSPVNVGNMISERSNATTHVIQEQSPSPRAELRLPPPNEVQQDADRIIKDIGAYQNNSSAKDFMKRKQEGKFRLNKTSLSTAQSAWTLEAIVAHKLFDTTCAVVIIANAVLIGLSVQHATSHNTEDPAIVGFSHLCTALFLIELILRLRVDRCEFFYNEEMMWNWFDFSLVVCSIVDFLLLDCLNLQTDSGSTTQIGSALKIIKMLRIVRIFRVFRFFQGLFLLALMILDSLKSLMWALIMLGIIIYVFTICFTQGATDYLKQSQKKNQDGGNQDGSDVRRLFGSIPKTAYSLVQAMLNGFDWGVVSDSLMKINWYLTFLFFFYIFFAMLAVLNIITGVFVDNAVETAKTEREFLVQKEMEIKERYVEEMRSLFNEMDEDQSGFITNLELQQYCKDKRVQSYFQALGLGVGDTQRLFKLLDDDGSGEIDVDEFLEGCLRLKGPARSIDVHTLMSETRQLRTFLVDRLGSVGLDQF